MFETFNQHGETMEVPKNVNLEGYEQVDVTRWNFPTQVDVGDLSNISDSN